MNLCAVFGDSPLQRIDDVGWYFRLRINSVSAGWVGGFGMGVTLSSPLQLTGLPDRAARVPRSWLAGYWGRTFANGQERLSSWKPQALRPGDEVGFLVDLAGECTIFVNDEERCRFADPPIPVKSQTDFELTALIDVAATATSVTFLDGAPPAASLLNRQGGHAGRNPQVRVASSEDAVPASLPAGVTVPLAGPPAAGVAAATVARPGEERPALQSAVAAAAVAAVRRVPQLPLHMLAVR